MISVITETNSYQHQHYRHGNTTHCLRRPQLTLMKRNKMKMKSALSAIYTNDYQ